MKKRFFITMGFIIISLSFIRLAITYTLATEGERLNNLETEAKLLNENNASLSDRIYHLSSLSRLTVEAYRQGFVKNTQVSYYSLSLPVALKP